MSYRTDARHAPQRVHPSTRVLMWRALGVGSGFLIAVGILMLVYAVA